MDSTTENRVAQFASIQSMAEIGIGSLVHSLHLPFGGHLLSLNQIFCLGLATRRSLRGRAIREAGTISLIVALLKLLSPAGKRVMPMLAIFMQGVLFATGLALLGANRLGAMLGAALSSVWGFLQPLAVAYLLFGETFFAAVQKLWNQLAGQLGVDASIGLELIVAVLGIKAVAAMVIAVLAWRASPNFESRYLARVDELWKRARRGPVAGGSLTSTNAEAGILTHARLAALDLINPLFLSSLLLCVIFLRSEAWGFALRTLGATYLLFFGIRATPTRWVHAFIERYPSLRRAIHDLRKE